MPGYALRNVSADLLDSLNTLASSPVHGEFEVRRIMREAQPLKSVDLASYYMIEGICSSLLNRPDDVRSSFEKAIRVGGWDAVVATNYAVALHEASDYSGAWDVIDRGLENFKGNREYVESAYTTLINTGALERAAEVEVRLNSLAGQEGGRFWSAYVSALRDVGVDPAKVGALIREAKEVVVRKLGGRPAMYCGFSIADQLPHLSIGISADAASDAMHRTELDVWARVSEMAEQWEEHRQAGAPSMLDWITFYLRRDPEHESQLHPA